MKPSTIRVLTTSVIAGVVLGAVMLALGIQHNTQGEFISDTGSYDLRYCVLIFGAWFVVGAALGGVGHLLARLVSSRLRR